MISARVRNLLVAGMLVATLCSCSSGSTKVPWKDPSAQGTISLYDKAGHPLTSGSITTHPFIWKAVGSIPAPSPFNGTGRNATLLAYQPRKGADPSEWSGDLISATTTYDDPAHPSVTEVATDFSLKDFLTEFPPRWDSIIQLRIYLGVPGTPLRTTPYYAAAVKVHGDKWTLVGG
jgi:hypothetical protein